MNKKEPAFGHERWCVVCRGAAAVAGLGDSDLGHSMHRGLRAFGGRPKSAPKIKLALNGVGGAVGKEDLLPASGLKSKAGQSPGHVSRCSGRAPAPKPTCVLGMLTSYARVGGMLLQPPLL